MRRICTTAMAASALALALPGVASAQHHSRHGARAGAHHRHHHRSRTITFAANTKTITTTSPSAPTTTKTEPMPGSSETVGTVTSFEGGVLKITLSDGTTVVSGKVTEQTQISCGASQQEGNDDNGDEHSEQGGGENSPSFGHHGDDMRGPSNSGGDDGEDADDGPQGEPAPTCGTAALVPGAKVQEAELHLSSAGAVWEKVALA
jgi:hypothetical protein